jgi:hypothetical protein
MKNITFSADGELIRQAKLVARSQGKSLNTAFREWITQFSALSGQVKESDALAKEAEALMMRLRHVNAGRRFTRDEMNVS